MAWCDSFFAVFGLFRVEGCAICHDCGTKYGTPREDLEDATFWSSVCDWCHEDKNVTSAEHYSWPPVKSQDGRG